METPSDSKGFTRRNFLGLMAAGSMSLPLTPWQPVKPYRLTDETFSFHVFSKHLQFLDYEAMAETAAEVGFDGVDLTVRPGGHVLPENVEKYLPKAVEAVKNSGLQALTMTTAVMDATDTINQKVLQTASGLGIRYYRTDWLSYPENMDILKAMEQHKQRLSALAALNQKLNIYGSYQNHSGSHYVGAPVWDLGWLLQDVKNPYLGCQYDIRHATVEGGFSWPLGLNILQPYINTIVIKDFKWGNVNGAWQVINTPIGEGMVDFPAYFARLKSLNLSVPVSVHFEYEMPENDSSLSEREKRRKTVEVMRKDLLAIKNYMSEAGILKS